MKKKISFYSYLKDVSVKEYYTNIEKEIRKDGILFKLPPDELLQIKNSDLDHDIISYKRKEDMKELTLGDLFNLMVKNQEETNKKFEEINKKFDEVNKWINETNKKIDETNQKVDETNQKVDDLRTELKSDIDKINKRLDIHEKSLKKANLL